MRPLVSPEEMARADEATISSGTPAFELMERAGSAIARAVIGLAGGRYGRRAVVVCGKGNNGGDGFVCARLLRRRGVAVHCLRLAAEEDFKGAARDHLELMRRAGVRAERFDVAALAGADVIVDAIFGTGFHGRVEGAAAKAIEAVNASGVPVVSVDIPSGIAGATGRAQGTAVKATCTVTMAAEKLGTALGAGALHAGRVVVADIGIAVTDAQTWMSEGPDVAAALPTRSFESHKRSAGSVVVLAGSDGMSGAALLTARAAGRAGAGYVTLCTTSYVDNAKKSVLPEVVSLVDGDHRELGPEALELFGEALKRADAVAVGPGLGRGERQRALIDEVLGSFEGPVVVDADGLNAVASGPKTLEARTEPAVITPHPGEMARLMETTSSEVQADRIGIARAAAGRFSCAVLLKGSRTVVAEPGGRIVVNPTGGPELATAGTGDVLTGVIAGLLAAGLEPFEAAWAGAYVHGLSGRFATRRGGARGVLAWDVAEGIGEAMASVTASEAPDTLMA